jgi:hypothetical protein
MGTAKRCYNTEAQARFTLMIGEIKEKRNEILFVHTKNVYLAAVKPVLKLLVTWFCVVLACQVKMQKNIVNLV